MQMMAEEVREVRELGHRAWPLVAAAALFLTWALCVRSTAMLFVGAQTTEPSYLFLVAQAAGFLLTFLAAGHVPAPLARGEKPPAVPLPELGIALGGVATLVCLTPWGRGLGGFGAWAVVGVLVGVAYGCAMLRALELVSRLGAPTALRLLLWAFVLAWGLAVALNALVPLGALAAVGVLPVGAAALLRGAEARLPEGPAAAPGEVRSGLLAPLLFCIGFLVVFVVGMHPKTAHLPWLVDEGVAYVGSLNLRSIVYLGLYGLLLAVAVAGPASLRRVRTPLVLGTLVVAYAAMFFTLPFMKTMPVAALLNHALSLLFLTLAVAGVGRLGPREALRGIRVVGAGCVAAACVAAVLMGPLFDVLPYQDEVFVAFPLVVNVAVAVLCIALGPTAWAALLPWGVSERAAGPAHPVIAPDADKASCAAICAAYGLSPRESQVLELVVQGRNEPYICDRLCVSRATVKTHVNHIYKKVGVASRQELLDCVRGE
jgi:DNA-binding CsgD family transcriptional regulator